MSLVSKLQRDIKNPKNHSDVFVCKCSEFEGGSPLHVDSEEDWYNLDIGVYSGDPDYMYDGYTLGLKFEFYDLYESRDFNSSSIVLPKFILQKLYDRLTEEGFTPTEKEVNNEGS